MNSTVHEHHHHGAHNGSHDHGSHAEEGYLKTASAATLHCLLGCSIGEFVGLFIGVAMGFSAVAITVLDTSLAFFFGFLLTMIPIMKRQKMSPWSAFKIVWLGETVSIGVMEVAMNLVDYYFGGMTVGSVMHWKFWIGFAIALPPGYIVALPVNYWMIKRNLKHCH